MPDFETPAFLLSRRQLLASAAATTALGACGIDDGQLPSPSPTPSPTPTSVPTALEFNFSNGPGAWKAMCTDYHSHQEGQLAFESGVALLPAPLTQRTAFRVSSNNPSDDVWMFIYAGIIGLQPLRRYHARIEFVLAANGGDRCVGAGGAPGEGVTVKAGIVPVEPAPRVDGTGMVFVNFDKGNQEQGSESVPVVGDFSTSLPDCTERKYELKTMATPQEGAIATSDAEGRLWLVIGTDSGFEGVTTAYYVSGRIVLTPA